MNDFICCACGANPLTDAEIENLDFVCQSCCEDDHWPEKNCNNSKCPFKYTCAGIDLDVRNEYIDGRTDGTT